jgi:hypothetical protein
MGDGERLFCGHTLRPNGLPSAPFSDAELGHARATHLASALRRETCS